MGKSGKEDIRKSVLIDYYTALSNKSYKATRVYESFLRMIEGGYWTPGDKLPSERELTEILPVGLATIQTAMGRLAQDGLLLRKRKAGSFVSEPAASGRELVYLPFIGEDGKTNLVVTDLELKIFETREQGKWSEFLGPKQKYVCVERLMSIGDEFLVFNRLFLGNSKFWKILDIPIAELRDITFRRMFKDRFGAPPMRMEREVSFLRLSPQLAEKLETNPGSPALLFQIRQHTLRDEALFFMESIVPENSRTMRII
ncbi:GntR family transcriptional regulator [uncultured Roseibium sp.]|uniref:GntR family transcriptional regulator n=1 Tax=uncultured Roseibium sp. TaxID=1936171 RepID=UPI00321687C6